MSDWPGTEAEAREWARARGRGTYLAFLAYARLVHLVGDDRFDRLLRRCGLIKPGTQGGSTQ